MLELLSPARDFAVGKIAIDSGADAVYIGAPRFSARHAAGNSIEDISALCRYAHNFGAKVLVALNTILTDDELRVARDIVWQLYDVGVDALIVQDMGLLTLDLPPIRLHASTQCDNRTPQKVRFLEQAGFRRVVLARELSLEQIKDIRRQTTVELEAFVHGALCVSYSGQCYLSQAIMNRSANRGECAQMCRQRYDLLDKDGNMILHDKHLLSLRDMDRSAYIKQLEDAGVTTLKIEGRLKDADYVKNITAYYRNIIDGLGIGRTSWGRTKLSFTPNPLKTFQRGATSYFLTGNRDKDMANFDTPKSIGEYVGDVVAVAKSIDVAAITDLHNGDGFVVGDVGFRASEAQPIAECGGRRTYRISCQPVPSIAVGARVYRNYDIEFQRVLLDSDSAVRLLPIRFTLSVCNGELTLAARQNDSGAYAEISLPLSYSLANNPERMKTTFCEQLSKLGGTCFYAENIEIRIDEMPFMRASEINALRRLVVEQVKAEHDRLCATRVSGEYSARRSVDNADTLIGTADYRANVHNGAARKWYAERGVDVVEPAFEDRQKQGAELMRCKYCLRYELGMCLKNDKNVKNVLQQPLYISTSGRRLMLIFDCKNCEMVVKFF